MTGGRRKEEAAVELAELQAKFEDLQRQQRADFSMPVYPPKVLITKCGIPRKSLDNWHAREAMKDAEFALDADAERGEERNRLYSKRDALLLSSVFNFSAIGAPLPVARRAAKLVVDCILETRVTNSIGSHSAQIVVFRRNDEWWIVPTGGPPEPEPNVPERQVRARIYSAKDGSWREEMIGEHLTDVPPLRMVLDVVGFGGRVLANLGLGVAVGSATELTRAARKLRK